MMASFVSVHIVAFRLRLFILSETLSLSTLSCSLCLGLDFAHHIKKAPVSSCPHILAFLGVLFDTSLLLSISLHVGLSVFPLLPLSLTLLLTLNQVFYFSKNSCSITVSSSLPDISCKVIVYGSLKPNGRTVNTGRRMRSRRREFRWPPIRELGRYEIYGPRVGELSVMTGLGFSDVVKARPATARAVDERGSGDRGLVNRWSSI